MWIEVELSQKDEQREVAGDVGYNDEIQGKMSNERLLEGCKWRYNWRYFCCDTVKEFNISGVLKEFILGSAGSAALSRRVLKVELQKWTLSELDHEEWLLFYFARFLTAHGIISGYTWKVPWSKKKSLLWFSMLIVHLIWVKEA